MSLRRLAVLCAALGVSAEAAVACSDGSQPPVPKGNGADTAEAGTCVGSACADGGAPTPKEDAAPTGSDAAATQAPCAVLPVMTYNLAALTHPYTEPKPTVDTAAARAKRAGAMFFAAEEVGINFDRFTGSQAPNMMGAMRTAFGEPYLGFRSDVQPFGGNAGVWAQAGFLHAADGGVDVATDDAGKNVVHQEIKLVAWETVAIPGARTVQRVDFEVTSSACAPAKLTALSVHLPFADYSYTQVMSAVTALLGWMDSSGVRPDILLGDFNLYPFDASVRAIEAAGYDDACKEPSALGPRTLPVNPPNPGPGSCRWTFTERVDGGDRHVAYDFIFSRRASRVRCPSAWAEQDVPSAISDHFPLASRCTLMP